jgi:hypothetical protein
MVPQFLPAAVVEKLLSDPASSSAPRSSGRTPQRRHRTATSRRATGHFGSAPHHRDGPRDVGGAHRRQRFRSRRRRGAEDLDGLRADGIGCVVRATKPADLRCVAVTRPSRCRFKDCRRAVARSPRRWRATMGSDVVRAAFRRCARSDDQEFEGPTSCLSWQRRFRADALLGSSPVIDRPLARHGSVILTHPVVGMPSPAPCRCRW